MKFVKRLMKEDKCKQEIFEMASVEGLNLKKVSKYLAMYPDPEESEKYNTANKILIGLYSFLVLIGILGLVPILMEFPPVVLWATLAFSLLISGVVMYSLFKKQSIGYLILCFLLFKGIFDSFKEYQSEPTGVLIGVCISLCLIVYVIVLKNKMFPYQNFFNTRKNSNGVAIFTNDLTRPSI